MSDIVPDKTYQFTKSGNLVRAVGRSGGKLWTVERVDGASAGKLMIVHERTLHPAPQQKDQPQ